MVWTALALVLVVVGYLGYNYYRVKRTLSEVPKKLVRRIASDDLGFGGDWQYVITPTSEGGCQLTITEFGKVPNPLFRFMSKYIFGQTATMEKYMKALAAKFGETPKIN